MMCSFCDEKSYKKLRFRLHVKWGFRTHVCSPEMDFDQSYLPAIACATMKFPRASRKLYSDTSEVSFRRHSVVLAGQMGQYMLKRLRRSPHQSVG